MHWIQHVGQEAPPQGAIKIVTGCNEGLTVDVLSWLDGSGDVTYDTRRVDCAPCLASPPFNVAHNADQDRAKVLEQLNARRVCPWCDQPITPGHQCGS